MFGKKSTVLFFLVSAVFLGGCAGIKEGAKGFLGISTKAIEDSRKSAMAKTFNYNFDLCYDKTVRVLKNMGAYIYDKDSDRKMVAFYISQEDTTVVGVFFTALDANSTRLEVASPSTYGKELIAKRLFSALDKALAGQDEDEKTDDKEKIKEEPEEGK